MYNIVLQQILISGQYLYTICILIQFNYKFNNLIDLEFSFKHFGIFTTNLVLDDTGELV